MFARVKGLASDRVACWVGTCGSSGIPADRQQPPHGL